MRYQPAPNNKHREYASGILLDTLKKGDTLYFVPRFAARAFDVYVAKGKNNIVRLTWEIAAILYDKGTRYNADLSNLIAPNVGYSREIWIRDELGQALFSDPHALKCETLP